MIVQERLDRAALSHIANGSQYLKRYGPADGLRQAQAAQDLEGGYTHRDPAETLERAEERGIRFVIPGDPEWPVQLDYLAYTQPLHTIEGAPVGLWIRGTPQLNLVVSTSVAVVGSRSSTMYGTSIAGDISAGVAEKGYAVISGGAYGIDNAAHRGALASRGQTVMVLACGVDRIYPSAHERLRDVVLDSGGLVISEQPPGAAPMRIRFLARNRIIAALAQGTVVVEAAIRSGALNAASWTTNLGRPLMGVPGPVTSAASVGVHQLIHLGRATLVTDAAEVLEVLNQKEGART